MDKQEKRIYYKNLRKKMDPETAAQKSRIICANFIKSEFYKKADTVMIYMPIQNEADTAAILEDIFKRGKRAAVPVVENDNMYAAYITENTSFRAGKFNISEPENIQYAEKSEIDLIAVPGIAFDRYGGRIGFGKGFYDRFLTGTNAMKAALCYDFQITETAFSDKHDIPMDYIVTETGIISIKNIRKTR